jgi:hypothetical protein
MAAVDRMVLEAGGRVLPPGDQGIVGMVGRVLAEASEDRLGELGAWCPDGQDGGGLLLAGGQGDNLEDVPVNPAGFVQDGQRVVESLEPFRDRRQDREGRSPNRNHQLISVGLDAALEVRVELHHPGRGPEAEAGLPLIGGHHNHLRTIHAAEELIERQDGGQGGLALASRQHPTGQPGRRSTIPGGGDQGPLPGPQPERLPDTMPTRDAHIGTREPRNGELPPAGGLQRQRRAIHGRLRAGLHGANLQP